MTSILNKFKSLAIAVMVFSFFIAVTLNSCTSNKKSENTETSAESEEHPADGEEHPADSEEHPTDSEEHPADSTKNEHPAEEEK